jgi:hypothetical protein
VDIFSGNDILDGNWHMITQVFDGSQVRGYVDAVQEASTSLSGTADWSTQTFSIGYRVDQNSSYYEKSLSDARMYDTALSSSEIQTLYDVVVTNGNLTTAAKTS